MSVSSITNLIVSSATDFGLALLAIMVAILAIIAGVLVFKSGYVILRHGSITGVYSWYQARRNYRKTQS